jgi:hypothetical protein
MIELATSETRLSFPTLTVTVALSPALSLVSMVAAGRVDDSTTPLLWLAGELALLLPAVPLLAVEGLSAGGALAAVLPATPDELHPVSKLTGTMTTAAATPIARMLTRRNNDPPQSSFNRPQSIEHDAFVQPLR